MERERDISKHEAVVQPSITAESDRCHTLKGRGVDLPKENVSYKGILEQLGKETDDEKIQELIDGLPYYVILYDLKKKKETSQFSSLSPLIREAGFSSRSNRPFATSLKSAGVPISIKERVVGGAKPQNLSYYIFLSRHKDRAIKALKEDQSLQKFQR